MIYGFLFQLCKKPKQNNMFCVENKHLFILFFQLKFFDYTITEQLLGNTTELFRLFKFDEFFMFDKVEKAFVNANKTMIAKALNSAVEVRSIDNQVLSKKIINILYYEIFYFLMLTQVDDWRTESFMDLGWLESLGRLVDIMSIGKY